MYAKILKYLESREIGSRFSLYGADIVRLNATDWTIDGELIEDVYRLTSYMMTERRNYLSQCA